MLRIRYSDVYKSIDYLHVGQEVEIWLLFENGDLIFENAWRQDFSPYGMRNHGRLRDRNIT